MATWTAPADKATDDIVTAAIWNSLFGTDGSLKFLYDILLPGAKRKSSTQVFTTNTTFADITASSGNLAFSMVASGIYLAQYHLPLTYGGTGGSKLQLTGPASPTKVIIGTDYPAILFDGTAYEVVRTKSFAASAFSSSFLALSSGSTTPGDISSGTVVVTAYIENGANAGDVTLQGAQNSSNSTTTFGADCLMVARRIG